MRGSGLAASALVLGEVFMLLQPDANISGVHVKLYCCGRIFKRKSKSLFARHCLHHRDIGWTTKLVHTRSVDMHDIGSVRWESGLRLSVHGSRARAIQVTHQRRGRHDEQHYEHGRRAWCRICNVSTQSMHNNQTTNQIKPS